MAFQAMSLPFFMRPSFTIHRLARSEEKRRADWLDALAAFDPRKEMPLKLDGLNGVWWVYLAQRHVALKRVSLDSPGARLKNFLHVSRSFRQWRGAQLLLNARIDTPRPFVLATQRTPKGAFEWIGTKHIQGPTLLALFADGVFTSVLATILGRHLARVTSRAHLFNRDHKPSNLIVHLGDSPERCRIAVLDTVGIRRISAAQHLSYAARMLASLIIEPTGCGCPPPKSFVLDIARHCVGTDSADAFQLANAALDARERHGDPTPRINPLA